VNRAVMSFIGRHMGQNNHNMSELSRGVTPECPLLDLPFRFRGKVYFLLCVPGHPRFPLFINLDNAGAPDW
jgi:hypothetical protein